MDSLNIPLSPLWAHLIFHCLSTVGPLNLPLSSHRGTTNLPLSPYSELTKPYTVSPLWAPKQCLPINLPASPLWAHQTLSPYQGPTNLSLSSYCGPTKHSVCHCGPTNLRPLQPIKCCLPILGPLVDLPLSSPCKPIKTSTVSLPTVKNIPFSQVGNQCSPLKPQWGPINLTLSSNLPHKHMRWLANPHNPHIQDGVSHTYHYLLTAIKHLTYYNELCVKYPSRIV